MLHVVGGLLLTGGLGASARAQIEGPDIQRLSPSSAVTAGVRLVQTGRASEAVSLLRPVLVEDSVRLVPPHGAVAYWLGRAYEQAGRPDKARSTWRTGLRALRTHGQFDVRLADAYLQSLTPKQLRGERLYAVDVYRSLFRRVGPDASSALQSLFRRRVAQIAPLMTNKVLGRVIEEDRSTKPHKWTFQTGADTVLVEWWRGLDPLPATAANERLEEHLARLVKARKRFPCSERAARIDDRGIVHLRFGAPYKRRSIDYKSGEFFTEVYRGGVQVPPSSFPKSEIWLYPHIDESGYYLFAEADTSDCYTIARANDLVPNYLTQRRPDTKRGLNIAYSAMMALRAVYRELALYHIDFSSRYSDIANYVSRQKMKATNAKATGTTSGNSVQVGSGIGQTRRVFENPALGLEFPTRFVPRLVHRAERADQAAAERRKEAMPRQYSTLLESEAQLPVAVRTARFLNDDGTTRTEVYWGVPASGLQLSEEQESTSGTASLITFSAVQYDARRRTRQRISRQYRINTTAEDRQRLIVPPPVTFRGTTERHHVSLQWEQYELWQQDSTSVGGGSIGQKRRLATARADSLAPLRAEGRVEMSDVKVLTLPDTSARSLATLTEQASPYPFRTLSADTPLLLSFEVYHLSFGADDRTRYTISYEAKGKTKRGWTNLFRGTDTRRTSTEMTMEGTSRRTEETIRLDLSQIERDEPQDVRVTVRVTDEVTGKTVSRDVEFMLRPREKAGE
ncbi:MAG: GWxTD domain-containing protein [Salinibacter sp.]|uniref:GWxTD domain-containing protein n=1 Tax=Salinibacter sp. TaxID=2065818 RepID=UPI0035D4F4C9